MIRVLAITFLILGLLIPAVPGLPFPDVSRAIFLAAGLLPSGYLVAAALVFPITGIVFSVMTLAGWRMGVVGLCVVACLYTILFLGAVVGAANSRSSLASEYGVLGGLVFFLAISAFLVSDLVRNSAHQNRKGAVVLVVAILVNVAAVAGFTTLNNKARAEAVAAPPVVSDAGCKNKASQFVTFMEGSVAPALDNYLSRTPEDDRELIEELRNFETVLTKCADEEKDARVSEHYFRAESDITILCKFLAFGPKHRVPAMEKAARNAFTQSAAAARELEAIPGP